jgi:NADH-quinone oxidoreductase subunit N
VLFYLVIYGFTTVAAFAVAAWLARDTERDDIDDLNGLGFRSPGLAVCIVLLMLSLIGMPPFAGFFGKLYMFMEALRTDETNRVTMIGLVALGFINSLISAFYYVRVLKAMFLRDEGSQPAQEAPAGVRWPILVGAVVAVGFGVFPQTLVKTASAAATMMLSGGVGIHDTPSPVAVLSPPAVPAGRPTADAVQDQANHQAGGAAEAPVATPPEPRPAP